MTSGQTKMNSILTNRSFLGTAWRLLRNNISLYGVQSFNPLNSSNTDVTCCSNDTIRSVTTTHANDFMSDSWWSGTRHGLCFAETIVVKLYLMKEVYGNRWKWQTYRDKFSSFQLNARGLHETAEAVHCKVWVNVTSCLWWHFHGKQTLPCIQCDILSNFMKY